MSRVAIIGGGHGGTAILTAIKPLAGVHVIGLAEVNPDAPGVKLAQQWGVPVYNDYHTLLRQSGLDIIIEATGNESVRTAVLAQKDSETSLIDSHAAQLMMNLVNSRQGMVDMVTSRAQQLAAMGQELQANSNQLVAKATDLAQEAEVMAEQGHTLRDASARASSSLGETDTILKMIMSVADRTKLLGLNAAIEAARAGEQGRGFTVVAQEIRKLADNSMASAGRVGSIIHEIQQSMGGIMDGIQNTGSVIEHQTSASEDLAEGSRILNQIAGQVLKMAEELASLAER